MGKPPTPEQPPLRRFWPRFWPWLVVLAAVVFAGCIRVRLLDLPLERDEGEYAYAGQLLLQGIPPYELAYNMKLPGTYGVYMLGMAVFGQTPAGVHLTLLVAGSLTIVFVFLLGRQLAGPVAGTVAAVCYAIMSVSPAVAGLNAHATHFVVLFAVPATWLLLRRRGEGNGTVFYSGLLFGLAFLMKQPGLCFGLFGLAYLAWIAWCKHELFHKSFARRALAFGLGLFLPFAVTCLALAFAGAFGRFWFWTVSYARMYGSELGCWQGIRGDLMPHLQATSDLSGPLWILTFAGWLVGLLVKPLRPAAFFGVVFCFFSLLGTAAGFYFRSHYFILMLPGFAVLAGLAVVALQKVAPSKLLPDVFKSLPVIAIGSILAWMVFYYAQIFFQWPVAKISQNLYRENPFAEAAAAAEAIREHSAPTARVAVIGSEPEIYFYAHRHSATGYIYTYALMEAQPYALNMQHDMAREIESARPEYLVNVPHQLSWLPQPGSSRYLMNWFEDYVRQYYIPTGIVGCGPGGRVISLWGAGITNTGQINGEQITIYQRSDLGGTNAPADNLKSSTVFDRR